MDTYLKEHRQALRRIARQDFKNLLLRPFRLSWQTGRMAWAVYRRREFDRSLEWDYLIMCASSKAACRRYVAWVQRFRDWAHHRSL